MPICSALVATRDPVSGALHAWLAADTRVTLGPRVGARTALVIEASSTAEISALLELIAARADVTSVLPTFHAFEDELPAAERAEHAKKRGAR